MQKDKHNFMYYFKCMIGGVLSCGTTHTMIVPIDVIKCRKQVYILFSFLYNFDTKLNAN